MVRSRYSISGKHMQKTAGTRRDPLSHHRQEPPVNEASGPHSLVVPAPEIEHAPGTFERDSTFESRSDALKVELAQVKATLAAREREIAALKERLAALEGNPVPQAPMLGPSEPATARSDVAARRSDVRIGQSGPAQFATSNTATMLRD